MNLEYFDLTNLRADWNGKSCPVVGCQAELASAPSQRNPSAKRLRPLPFCRVHGIRIHPSRTFVYFAGNEDECARASALRIVRFHREYFASNVLGNAFKAESGRFAHETSEDALTWNVFSSLATQQRLRSALEALVGVHVPEEPQLFLWGLRVDPADPRPSATFEPLLRSRNDFEPDIRRMRTEPDVILFAPGRLLVLIEAKFTSGNALASPTFCDEAGEKPRSIAGVFERYTPAKIPSIEVNADPTIQPFYEQLYRNLVFAVHMSEQLDVEWYVVNLVSKRQFAIRSGAKHQDPTSFFEKLLAAEDRRRFRFVTWEGVHKAIISGDPLLGHVAEYIERKSAGARPAFELS